MDCLAHALGAPASTPRRGSRASRATRGLIVICARCLDLQHSVVASNSMWALPLTLASARPPRCETPSASGRDMRATCGPYHLQILSEVVGGAQKYSWCSPPGTELARTATGSHKQWRDLERGLICIPGGGSGDTGTQRHVRTPGIVMGGHDFRMDRRRDADSGINQLPHAAVAASRRQSDGR